MRLKKMHCPNCDGILDIKLDNKEYIFCPYCGDKFFVEDGEKHTINRNIHIKKDINITKHTSHTNRYVDDADVIRAKTENKEHLYKLLGWIGPVILWLLVMGICFYMIGAPEREAQKAIESGKISAGANEDYEGTQYEAAVAQLKALGFENITCIDLDYSGLLFWTDEKVASISINGDTSFYSGDYFYPDSAVIINYH